MKQTTTITCPKCKQTIRMQENSDKWFSIPGSPFRKCNHCGTEYFDTYYREIALEQENDCGTYVKHETESREKTWRKKGWFRKKNANADNKPETETAYEDSLKRIRDYNYLVRLYQCNYHKRHPEAEKKLSTMILNSLTDKYIRILEQKIGAPNREYRPQNASELLDQLTYDAHKPGAVEKVVREVLSHYGLDQTRYTVLVEYKPQDLKTKKENLGTYTNTGCGRGIIRIFMFPRYSEYDMVIGVIMHECAHALLHSIMVSLPDRDENERLTDVAAIYMGGDRYLQRGYFMFHDFHAGYMKDAEINLLCGEIARRRENALRAKRTAAKEMEALIAHIERKWKSLPEITEIMHPNRVVRESATVMEIYGAMMNWKEKTEGIAKLIRMIRQGEFRTGNPEKDLLRLKEYDRETTAYERLLRDWQRVEDFQTQESAEKTADRKKLLDLAESGNAFAKLELIRYWTEHTETARDAMRYYDGLRKKDEDPDSLYAAGICCMQGLGTRKDENEGRSLLCKAAALGSQNAIRVLTCAA